MTEPDGGERLHTWMAGNGTDGEIDVAVRREFVVTHRARQGSSATNGGTFAFDGLQAELIAEGRPVTGTVTHPDYRVRP